MLYKSVFGQIVGITFDDQKLTIANTINACQHGVCDAMRHHTCTARSHVLQQHITIAHETIASLRRRRGPKAIWVQISVVFVAVADLGDMVCAEPVAA